jgi:hypothetical protein
VDFVVGTFIPASEAQQAKGFIGYSGTVISENLFSNYTEENSFFTVFAVYFPAVTGIFLLHNEHILNYISFIKKQKDEKMTCN